MKKVCISFCLNIQRVIIIFLLNSVILLSATTNIFAEKNWFTSGNSNKYRIVELNATGINAVFGFNSISLISPGINDFSVSRESGGGWYSMEEQDYIEGFGSLIPQFSAGIGIKLPKTFLDFTGGFGYLWNGAFYGAAPNFDFAVRFRTNQIFTIGLHSSIYQISPKWSGVYSDENDVKLSSFTGICLGPTLSVGKLANFVFSIDYFMGKSDVSTSDGWHPSSSTLDLTGVIFNVGFLLRVPK